MSTPDQYTGNIITTEEYQDLSTVPPTNHILSTKSQDHSIRNLFINIEIMTNPMVNKALSMENTNQTIWEEVAMDKEAINHTILGTMGRVVLSTKATNHLTSSPIEGTKLRGKATNIPTMVSLFPGPNSSH